MVGSGFNNYNNRENDLIKVGQSYSHNRNPIPPKKISEKLDR